MQVNQQSYRTIWPSPQLDAVYVIDQTKLPHAFVVAELREVKDMVHAIKTMQVRGAPLIGTAAAYGIALATSQNNTSLQQAANALLESRPTAVNLQWAVTRMLRVLNDVAESDRPVLAWKEAAKIADEDVAQNLKIAEHGLGLLQAIAERKQGTLNILTHCNAGWLATVDWGTALAPIYLAHERGMDIHVWVDETRPRNQGASLTAWELVQHGIPHTVVADNAGGYLMQHGQVDCVIVGADRVTGNGDVCNKIGTYLKALAASDNGVPFYVAVPSPTIDWTIRDAHMEIPIEMRSPEELRWVTGSLPNSGMVSVDILPKGSQAINPAFDVTPERLVSAIITEKGVCSPDQLRKTFNTESI